MPIDPSILLGAKGIELPSPVAMAQQGLSLADLASQNQIRQYALQTAQRRDQATQALGQILPALQQGGFSDQAIQAALTHPLVRQNPDIADQILKYADDRRKQEADIAKTRADTAKSKAAAQVDLLKPLTNQAFSLATDPSLSPEKIAAFSKQIAANGLENLVANVPFQDWNNPDAARKNLRTIGSAFFEAEKQVSTAETARKNVVDEGHARDVLREAERFHTGELGVQNRNASTSAGQLQLARENAGRLQHMTGPNGEPLTFNPITGAVEQAKSGAGQPLNLPPKMPDSVKKEVMDLGSEQATVRAALRDVEKTKSAFSLPRGMATNAGSTAESLAGRNDSPEEREVRAFVFNVVSGVIKQRAGTAQSAQELQRINSFLPANTDNAEQIMDKFRSYDRYLEEKKLGYTQPPGAPLPRTPPAGASGSFEGGGNAKLAPAPEGSGADFVYTPGRR